MQKVYLNGEMVALNEARISVMDRGFLFGDGVYEVIPVYSRRPFRLFEHLRRLQRSLDGIRLANPHTDDEWTALIKRLIAATDADEQQIYLQVTRGADTVRNHAFPKVTVPTVFMKCDPLIPPHRQEFELGIAAVSASDNRWLRCDIKSTSLLANCLLRQQAEDAGCIETLLFRDGFLSEASASNVFVVRDGVLVAPPKTHLILPGITYDVVLELATRHGLSHELRDVTEAEVRLASEIWICSSTREVRAVVSLDGRSIGTGRPGPVYEKMHRWYQEFKSAATRAS
ncbi:MAG: D-amino acid aminotransferase [Proteobacteria bacterium]|nr:D-amino acid aminotransferase [Pseudomonadota bacterium]